MSAPCAARFEGGACITTKSVVTYAPALALEASLIVRYGSSAEASAFVSSRIAGDCGHTFGTLPKEVDAQSIVSAVANALPRSAEIRA